MATLGDMKASIASEIFRDDLTDAIAAEITRAIRFYQRARFWFNETRQLTFNTVAGQDFYTATAEPRIPNLLQIDYIQVAQGGRPLSLIGASAEDLDQWSYTPTTGVPSNFAYFEQVLRLYPVPNSAYPVRIAGLVRVDPPTTDTDGATNPWMNDAEELIRSRAKRNLYLHYMGDQQMAAGMKAAEDEALSSLKGESAERQNVHAFVTDCI
jgi:hypothetical protein